MFSKDYSLAQSKMFTQPLEEWFSEFEDGKNCYINTEERYTGEEKEIVQKNDGFFEISSS